MQSLPQSPFETNPLHEKPTRVRYLVLTYLCVLAFILYLDRACIGQAGPRITHDLGLTNEQFGDVQAAFTLGYGLFMAIGGRIGDRFGSRIVLVVLVVWWSTLTSLTAAATSLVMLLVIRFIFGLGEAGAFPNCAESCHAGFLCMRGACLKDCSIRRRWSAGQWLIMQRL